MQDPDQYWIGKVLPKWKVYEAPGNVAGSEGRVRYDKGDVEFEVQWYDRDISSGEERRIFKRQTSLENRACTCLGH